MSLFGSDKNATRTEISSGVHRDALLLHHRPSLKKERTISDAAMRRKSSGHTSNNSSGEAFEAAPWKPACMFLFCGLQVTKDFQNVSLVHTFPHAICSHDDIVTFLNLSVANIDCDFLTDVLSNDLVW